MWDNPTLKNIGRTRRLLASAGGLTLLLLAGTACGTKSQPASDAGAATAPAAATAATRTDPSPEQVSAAIAQLKERVRMSFVPNESNVRAFADAACSAFDQGKTAPQVRDLVLQTASQLPSIAVTPSDADFAVGTAVKLFCPGYSNKLAS